MVYFETHLAIMNEKYLQNDSILQWVDSLLNLIAYETATQEDTYPTLDTKARD